MAGRVDGAGFESVGELELKGIPEPMEAFAVLWEPLDPERSGVEVGRWPVPDALRTVPSVACVGRVTERGLLEHARSEARSGARRLVLLSRRGMKSIASTTSSVRSDPDSLALWRWIPGLLRLPHREAHVHGNNSTTACAGEVGR
jgi:hypothetical protein